MTRSYPRISIVTPSYNQAIFLEDCIDSILSQNYPNLEYIIMDGGSTDGSVEIIKKYEKHLACWQSCPDGGQYPAVLEGFRRSSGEVMAYLNSDDKYHPGALWVVAEIFSRFHDVEWIMGRPTYYDQFGNIKGILPYVPTWSRRILLEILFDKVIQQESTFWRRTLWDRAGGYLHAGMLYAGDFELWSRFFRNAQLYCVDALLSGFRSHSCQKTNGDGLAKYVDEAQRILLREICHYLANPEPLQAPPPPLKLDQIFKASEGYPCKDNFDLFTFSQNWHFQVIGKYDVSLYGKRVGSDSCDLATYQELLVYAFIINNLPPGSKVLDMGGGLKLLEALKGDYDCWATNRPIDSIENKSLGFEFNKLSQTPTPSTPAEFDFAFSISCLQHMEQTLDSYVDFNNYLQSLLKTGSVSLHCIDFIYVENNTKVRDHKILYDLYSGANNVVPINKFVVPGLLYAYPDFYVMGEEAYNAYWKPFTGMEYSAFGRPFSYNVLLEKRSDSPLIQKKTHVEAGE